jgi:hypothetical protein
MLASELIKGLSLLVQQNGDCEVRDEDGYDLAGAEMDEDADTGEQIITISQA